jgi:hypothetical protein
VKRFGKPSDPGWGRLAGALRLGPFLALLLSACHSPDPQKLLDIQDTDGFWVLDPQKGGNNYLVPVVSFRLKNIGTEPLRAVQTTATFRRKGEAQSWGSAWSEVASWSRPLRPGGSTEVELKSDGRYYSQGPPESMFEHKLFRDATVEVFFKVSSSNWVKMASVDIERRLGSRKAKGS